MKIFAVPVDWSKTLCIVEAVSAEDLERYLTADEKARVENFPREKRRAEWSASRIAAKLLALERKLCVDPKQCAIISSYRKPTVAIEGQDRELYVSISHSSGAGAAALDEVPIGIDIQKVRELKARATKFFLKDEELAQMQATSIDHRMIHFWCAKEAAYKLRAGRGWLKRVSISLENENHHGLSFALSYPVEGTVDTFPVSDDFVAAVARQLKRSDT